MAMTSCRLGTSCFIFLVLTGNPAAAHHVMGGKTPATFFEGFLSGLGHPIIGIDHFAFIVAAGLVVGVARLNLAVLAVFIGASALGVAIHVQGVGLPAAEALVAISVLAIGCLLAARATMPTMAWLALFAAAGLVHGYAYGESIFGAESTPLYAYLAGLVVVQTGIAGVVATAVQRRPDMAPLNARLAGAGIAGIGLTVLAAQILPS